MNVLQVAGVPLQPGFSICVTLSIWTRDVLIEEANVLIGVARCVPSASIKRAS